MLLLDRDTPELKIRRTSTPRRLPSPFVGVQRDSTNATVVDAFTLHYGPNGPRVVEPGSRCTVVDVGSGICRFTDRRSEGAIAELAHFELDADPSEGRDTL